MTQPALHIMYIMLNKQSFAGTNCPIAPSSLFTLATHVDAFSVDQSHEAINQALCRRLATVRPGCREFGDLDADDAFGVDDL